jgi:hypothetical protein
VKIEYLLLDKLKRHGYYKGKLREAYDQKLQARLSVGQKLYLLTRPELMDDPQEGVEPPGLRVTKLEGDEVPYSWLFELTITVKMAREFKASDLKLDDELPVVSVWIPWTPACADAPMVQLCGSCWKPMVEVLRKRLYKDLQYPYICDNCGETYSYKQVSEEVENHLEGSDYEEDPEEDD